MNPGYLLKSFLHYEIIKKLFHGSDLVKFNLEFFFFSRKEKPDEANATLLKGWTEDNGPMYRNITTSVKPELQADATSLRRNPYYYQIYYVYLNTLFASVLPLSLLLFFNIRTAQELVKMSRLGTARMATRNPR